MVSLKARRIAAICIFLMIFAAFSGVLFKLQVIDGDEYHAASASVSSRTVSISAARGEIVDRYGSALVVNHQGYSLIFDGAFFPSASNQTQRNEIIISLINLLESSGEEWEDTLPLEFDADGKIGFSENRDSDIKRMKGELLNLNEYATAQNCFDALITRYKLEYYTPEQARKIASVCLAMKSIGFGISTPYTFATDVSEQTVARIKENSVFYQGVDVEVVPYREFTDGTLAPHILGRVAAIDSDEYAELKSEGYSITDEIGKSGLEYAMESYLRGTAGEKTVSINAEGKVVDSVITLEPQQGNTVVSTIDSRMQAIVQKSLRNCLLNYADERNSMVEPAGAAVVIDCNTGDILACASYPTYDISTYSQNYSELANTAGDPLWNRALLSTYATGSTMKPSVAIAALEEGLIAADDSVYCSGIYTYLHQNFKCEQNHATRHVNVIAAIKESCNTFFYEVGKNLGINKMNEYRTLFGFGQKTGCELSEASGILDSPEYRESLNQTWRPGFTVQSAIGQAGNLISPIQLANYCATIANGGTRYRTRFVKSVLTYDNSEIVLEGTPEVLCSTGVSEKTLDIVREGMHQVCSSTTGYCYRYFNHLDSSIDPAAKTGTSQEYRNIDGVSVKINNGFLITYAPYDNPQIAIALVGEGMTSGVFVAPVAADVYEYYFAEGDSLDEAATENTLLG